MGIRTQHSSWRQKNGCWNPSFTEETQAPWIEAYSGTHHPGGRRLACWWCKAGRSQAREILMGYQQESCHREGVQTLDPPQAVGRILRRIQISTGQIPKQPDLRLKLTLLWAGVLDQINSSSNLKHSVMLWILAGLNKNRPEDWTASIPMESHREISESCGIFSFIWGTSWDITRRDKSKLWYVLTMLL